MILAAWLVVQRQGTSSTGRVQLEAVARGLVLFAAYLALRSWSDLAEAAVEAWASVQSSVVSFLGGLELQLGPRACGTDALVLASGVALGTVPRSWRRLGALLAALVTISVTANLWVIELGALADRWIGLAGHGGYNQLDFAWFHAALLAVPLAVVRVGTAPANPREPRVASVALVGAVSLALGVSFSTVSNASASSPTSIAIHDSGYLDRRLPQPGVYGARGTGMFGLLEEFLDGHGHRAFRRDLTEAPELEDVDLLVLINLVDRFDEATLEAIWRFVEDGGGLLVLADHTGMETIRVPSNLVIGRYGIEVGFDSAVSFSGTWVDGQRFRRHPTTAGIASERETQIWTGASLAVDHPAYPIVLGTGAYVDEGDETNVEKGYLGDFHHHHHERLGDVTLVAGAEPGDGRVLAFGDTSTFQNLALTRSRRFALQCVDWLDARDAGSGADRSRRVVVGSILLCLLASLVPFRRPVAGSWLALAAATLIAGTWHQASRAAPTRVPFQGSRPVAHVTLAFDPPANHLGWKLDALGGLQVNLMRLGWMPFLSDEPLGSVLPEADLLFVPGASRDLAPTEHEQLRTWLRAGGVAVVNQDHEAATTTVRLMELLGVEIDEVPLGPAEAELLGAKVKFHDAYPVRSTTGTVLARAFENPVAVWQPIGEGGALVLGDGQFFFNKNLEDEELYIPENVAGLGRIVAFARARSRSR